MKTKILFLLCCFSLAACAQRMADDAGDDDVTSPDASPTPDPAACDSDDDCRPIDGCSAAACVAGACSSEPACGAGQACDEGRNACVDVVPPPLGSGAIVCAEVPGYVEVTVSGGILDHLVVNPAASPTTSWKLVYGSNPGDWEVPYPSGSTKDWKAWTTDGASYKLRLPNSVTSFNIALTNGTDANSEHWLDLNEYVVSGSTCAHVADGGGITRTATSVSAYGTLKCEMTSETGSLKRKVTITPNVGRDIRDALSESPSPLPSPSVIQYGGSDGWTLPYASGSTKPQLSWTSGTATYTLYLDPAVDDFNFFVVDNDDPSDSWSGGDFFDLDRWSVTNVGSAGCHRVGGGISIN